jgi:hypothetical protein
LLDVDGFLACQADDALRRQPGAARAFGSIDADDDFIVLKPILKIDTQRSHRYRTIQRAAYVLLHMADVFLREPDPDRAPDRRPRAAERVNV